MYDNHSYDYAEKNYEAERKYNLSCGDEYEIFSADFEFDLKQKEVLDSKSNKFLVTGPPGSGKTILAIAKIKQLKEANYNFNVITYTRALKQFMTDELEEQHIDFDRIFNYHELDKDINKSSSISNLEPDFIIIDEVQDFNIEIVRNLASNAKEGYFLYGDSEQILYPYNTNSSGVINDILSLELVEEIYNLDYIYRFSNTIYNFAKNIVCSADDYYFIKPKSHLQDSDIPIIHSYNSYEKELSAIYSTITINEWDNVGILVATGKEAKYIANWFNKNTRLAAEYKCEHDIDMDFTNNLIKVMPYHSSKGLEFDRVFMPNCYCYEHEKKYNYKEALYVAATRCKYSLIISYNRDNDFEKFDYKEYHSSPYLDKIPKDTYISQNH